MLGEYSAFIFENYPQEIKKMLRKCGKPLKQLQNRMYEFKIIGLKEVVNTSDDNYELRKEWRSFTKIVLVLCTKRLDIADSDSKRQNRTIIV